MSSLLNLRKEHAEAQRQLAEIEKKIQKAESSTLLSLPARAGFRTVDELIKALIPHASPVLKGRYASLAGAPVAKTTQPAKAPIATVAPIKASRKKKRTRITPEKKEQVQKAVKEGKSGSAIAKDLGISVASVQNIKKEFGLIKKR